MIVHIWRNDRDSSSFSVGTTEKNRTWCWGQFTDEALRHIFGRQVSDAAEELGNKDTLEVRVNASILLPVTGEAPY